MKEEMCAAQALMRQTSADADAAIASMSAIDDRLTQLDASMTQINGTILRALTSLREHSRQMSNRGAARGKRSRSDS